MLRFRSLPDSDTKTSDKIGRGFDKLKQGVFGKTMEGVVDPLDTALDVSHYVDVRFNCIFHYCKV